MKKVLFLINTLNGGGAEKVLVDTVNSLDANKYDITVQTVYDIGIFKEKLAENIKYKTIIKSKNKVIRRILSKVLISFFGSRFIYNRFVFADYDYEIAFLEGLPTKIISSSADINSKKYAWVHTDLINNPNSWRFFGSVENESIAYKKFDKIFCVSNSVKDAFEKKYGSSNSLHILYNIVNDTTIVELSKEAANVPTTIKPVFVSAGRFVEQKGYERLLRVHKRLISEGYSHSLILLGDGELRPALESYIREQSLCDTVFLLGFQSNPYKYISKCDLFVCSSIAEGYSTVVSESILCGTPVLSTDVAGSREPIEAPRCSVVVENSELGLYEALKNVLQSPNLIKNYKQELPFKQMHLKREYLISEFERIVFD